MGQANNLNKMQLLRLANFKAKLYILSLKGLIKFGYVRLLRHRQFFKPLSVC